MPPPPTPANQEAPAIGPLPRPPHALCCRLAWPSAWPARIILQKREGQSLEAAAQAYSSFALPRPAPRSQRMTDWLRLRRQHTTGRLPGCVIWLFCASPTERLPKMTQCVRARACMRGVYLYSRPPPLKLALSFVSPSFDPDLHNCRIVSPTTAYSTLPAPHQTLFPPPSR